MLSRLIKILIVLAALLVGLWLVSRYMPKKNEAGVDQPILSETAENTGKIWFIASACELFRNEYGVYPSSLALLESKKLIKPEDKLDTFGNDIIIKDVSKTGFSVASSGKDGKPGTDDDVVISCSSKNGKLSINTVQSSKGQLDTGKLLVPVKDGK